MTWKDKLEIGLKGDAPFRKDNLPLSEVRGPEIPSGPGRSPEISMARGSAAWTAYRSSASAQAARTEGVARPPGAA